jgi:hypothetical protein
MGQFGQLARSREGQPPGPGHRLLSAVGVVRHQKELGERHVPAGHPVGIFEARRRDLFGNGDCRPLVGRDECTPMA